ncbi:hypothetical protein TNCV_751071 [Trichonephila clavipes]|nr:hypothetical protein TNCV_751071 [Trichonephila clavipes]
MFFRSGPQGHLDWTPLVQRNNPQPRVHGPRCYGSLVIFVDDRVIPYRTVGAEHLLQNQNIQYKDSPMNHASACSTMIELVSGDIMVSGWLLNCCLIRRHTGSTIGIMIWSDIGFHSRTSWHAFLHND